MSVTRKVQKYIREHPSVADCLERGLINYSALAREICEELKIDAFDAVLVAARRFQARFKDRAQHEKRIISLIKNSKVHIRNRIVVAIIEKIKIFEDTVNLQREIRRERGDFNIIEGEEVVTIITNDAYLKLLDETFGNKIKKVHKNLVQICMLFDSRLETTSGVVSYVYRMFAENDINIREEMSCWTDVMILIDEKDLARAMQVLSL